MEQKDWWQAFTQSGRVEDYLRYRGVSLTQAGREGEPIGGEPSKTASDDRRTGGTGV